MYPFGWSASEREPAPVPNFKTFQDLDPRLLEGAAMTMANDQAIPTLDWCGEVWPEYRDGHEFRKSVTDWLDRLCYEDVWNSMLRCWLDHDRDMVRAKLAWTPEY